MIYFTFIYILSVVNLSLTNTFAYDNAAVCVYIYVCNGLRNAHKIGGQSDTNIFVAHQIFNVHGDPYSLTLVTCPALYKKKLFFFSYFSLFEISLLFLSLSFK